MNRKPLRIIGINPGTRYLGIAVLDGSELLDWRIKTLEGRWSEEKIKQAIGVVSELIERYELDVLAIKKLHPSRRTENLLRLSDKIKNFARLKKLKVFQYSIKDIEKSYIVDEKLNKRNLFEALVKFYPELYPELKKEQSYKNPYHTRIIEAVALASACSHSQNL